jgi:hypothetical protein
MTYYELLNLCIIYGGRDDNQQGGASNMKKDIFVLDMENLVWVCVDLVGFM